MELQKITAFFKWCTILNAVLLFFSAAILMLMPEFAFNAQSKFFHVSREAFDVIFYAFLAAYKLLWLIFNVVPWAALAIIAKK
ncbi:MAG: hypothetical protein OEY85_09920 [Rhodospirillales bacterium]|nr:hypothetical protein [Rhodospirillales bacterium]